MGLSKGKVNEQNARDIDRFFLCERRNDDAGFVVGGRAHKYVSSSNTKR